MKSLLVLLLAATPLSAAIIAGPYRLETNCVSWVSDSNATAWVEWNDSDGTIRRVAPSRDGLVEALTRIHRVTLEHLTPGLARPMRAITRDIVKLEPYSVTFGVSTTNEFTFRAPPATSNRVSFVMLNDVHSQETLLRKLLAPIVTNLPDAVILNGDIVNDPRTETQIVPTVLRPLGEMLGVNVPLWFVRGNHETRGPLARQLDGYLLPPGQRWYRAFTFGPVRVILLDAGEDKEDTHKAYSGLADFDRYREEQARWLAAEVAGEAFRNARYRVVFSHIPPFSTDEAQSWHGPQQVLKLWAPLCRGVGLTAWFSGHTHKAEVVDPQPGQHDYPVFIGGGSKPLAATVTRIEADARRMKVTILNADGAALVERTLK